MTTKNWVQVSHMDGVPNAPLKSSTLYKWAHLRRHSEIFRRVGRKLFVDMDKLYELAEAGKLR